MGEDKAYCERSDGSRYGNCAYAQPERVSPEHGPSPPEHVSCCHALDDELMMSCGASIPSQAFAVR